MVDVGEDSDEDRLARDRLLGVVGTDYTIPRNETGTRGFLTPASYRPSHHPLPRRLQYP